MIEIGDTWRKALDDLVASTSARTQTNSMSWRTAGRATKARPGGDDLDFWRKDGVDQVTNYVEWLNKTDWIFVDVNGEPMVEFAIQCEFGGVPVKGFLDACMATPDGEVVLIDYKTGSRTPDSYLQMGLYAAGLEVMGYPRPSLGTFWMTRKAEMTPAENLDRFTVHFFDEMFGMFRQAVDSDIFIPNVSGHCRSCGVANACYAAGGTDAYIYDPMHPSYTPLQPTHKEKK